MNCAVSFGSINSEGYDEEYRKIRWKNGIFPDSKVIKTINKYCPKGRNIADIGAGDGRNAVPLVKRGYYVDAFELSDEARLIMEKKQKKLPGLKIFDDNILHSDLSAEKYDGIYMARVSQHFYDFDVPYALNNFYQGLKKGGIVLFDALVKKEGFPERNDMDICFDAESGVNPFEPNFVEDSARDAGFDMLEVSKYKKDLFTSPKYFGPKWGFGFDTTKEFVRPVQLKWFTLIK